jgi:Ca2+/Na+ antiporter
MATRFGLRSLFYITFLFGSSSLAARLAMDMPNFAVPVVFVVAWLTILTLILASIVLRR